MQLKDLKKKGALVTGALVKKELTWTRIDPESGEEKSDTFSVFVVKQLSIASYDAIFGLSSQDTSRSTVAAIVAECIRLGDEGEEKINYADASRLEPSLAILFATAAREVHEALKKARDEKAGNSQPPTSSGTNSSSPASEAEQ